MRHEGVSVSLCLCLSLSVSVSHQHSLPPSPSFSLLKRCNRLNFVDVLKIRHGLHLSSRTGGLPPPLPLPPCLGCGRADGFEIGSTDYVQAIADRER
jgi:hypothetical protein